MAALCHEITIILVPIHGLRHDQAEKQSSGMKELWHTSGVTQIQVTACCNTTPMSLSLHNIETNSTSPALFYVSPMVLSPERSHLNICVGVQSSIPWPSETCFPYHELTRQLQFSSLVDPSGRSLHLSMQ
jgi:hypothetical protein